MHFLNRKTHQKSYFLKSICSNLVKKLSCLIQEKALAMEETAAKKLKTVQSKKFTVRINNLNKFHSVKAVSELILKNCEGIEKSDFTCKKSNDWTWAFVNFKEESHQLSCVKNIAGQVYKNQTLEVEKIEAEERIVPVYSRVSLTTLDSNINPAEVLNDKVTPFWRLDYPEQLKKKYRLMVKVMRKYWKAVGRWTGQNRHIPLEEIIPSPLTVNYRNKCEFAFGLDHKGNRTIGFMLGSFKDGIIALQNPSECVHVTQMTKDIVQEFQKMLQESNHKPFDKTDKSGIWRLLTVRHQSSGEILILVQIHPQKITAQELDGIKSDIQAVCSKFTAIKAIYFQASDNFSDGADFESHLELLKGEQYVTDVILGSKFRISPFSFFQVNTPAANVLYERIGEYAFQNVEKKVVLLDLCCGAGTIGISLAQKYKIDKIVGIETVKDAIEDAVFNAKENSVASTEYICDSVENQMKNVIERIDEDHEIVIVLDPPRSGMPSSVIKTIRACSRIRSIVYVACNPSAALRNFEELSRPTSKQYLGNPFIVSRGVPVDMFPQTDHCELVLKFTRE